MGQGAVGSVLAAVGTALPETMIPMVAILGAVFAGRDPDTAGEIGIGAILGAPFLLATLAMFVVGASAYTFRKRRAEGAEVRCREANAGDEFPWCKTTSKDVVIDEKTIAQDIGYFLVFFAVAVAAGILPLPLPVRIGFAVLLIGAYSCYVRLRFQPASDPPGPRSQLLQLCSCIGAPARRPMRGTAPLGRWTGAGTLRTVCSCVG